MAVELSMQTPIAQSCAQIVDESLRRAVQSATDQMIPVLDRSTTHISLLVQSEETSTTSIAVSVVAALMGHKNMRIAIIVPNAGRGHLMIRAIRHHLMTNPAYTAEMRNSTDRHGLFFFPTPYDRSAVADIRVVEILIDSVKEGNDSFWLGWMDDILEMQTVPAKPADLIFIGDFFHARPNTLDWVANHLRHTEAHTIALGISRSASDSCVVIDALLDSCK